MYVCIVKSNVAVPPEILLPRCYYVLQQSSNSFHRSRCLCHDATHTHAAKQTESKIIIISMCAPCTAYRTRVKKNVIFLILKSIRRTCYIMFATPYPHTPYMYPETDANSIAISYEQETKRKRALSVKFFGISTTADNTMSRHMILFASVYHNISVIARPINVASECMQLP